MSFEIDISTHCVTYIHVFSVLPNTKRFYVGEVEGMELYDKRFPLYNFNKRNIRTLVHMCVSQFVCEMRKRSKTKRNVSFVCFFYIEFFFLRFVYEKKKMTVMQSKAKKHNRKI